MASTSSKIIAVVGATGNQGSSVVRTYLSRPGWHVRAITRNPFSEKALALKSQGAELVQADLSDVLSLTRAFANANAIFVNTDFWETYRTLAASGLPVQTWSRVAYEKEFFYGKNAAIAAAGTLTLERFVYSYLPSPRDASHGKYNRTFHPESKWSIVKYIQTEESELAKKMSLICLGGYVSNPLFSPTKDQNSGQYLGVTALNRDTKIPIIDPEEATGPFVRALIEEEQPSTRLLAYNNGSFLSIEEIFQVWSSVTGKPVQYVQMTTEQLHQRMKLPWELLDGLDAVNEVGYVHIDGVIQPHQLKNPPKTTSWKAWLQKKGVKELLGEL